MILVGEKRPRLTSVSRGYFFGFANKYNFSRKQPRHKFAAGQDNLTKSKTFHFQYFKSKTASLRIAAEGRRNIYTAPWLAFCICKSAADFFNCLLHQLNSHKAQYY